MSQTLRTLLVLLKKNNSQPGVLTSLWVIVAMAAFSAFDAARPLSPPAWFGMFMWILILGTSSGAGAFSVDLKSNHIRFLEYLPVRRWHIWLSDWGDGVLWLGGMLLIVTVPRTINWTPPVEAERGGPEYAFNQIFFSTRWSLLLGLAGLGFCSYGIGAFFRVLVERDSAMILRSIMTSFAVCTGVWVVPVMLRIIPALHEAAVPLFILGALFSAGSFVLFVLEPKHWGVIRRWVFLRMPCLVFVHVASAAIVLLACRQWARLDLAKAERVNVARTTRTGNADALLVSVFALRSGDHLLHLDIGTGRHQYLGRGVSAYYRGESPAQLARDGRLLLQADFAAGGLWPTKDSVVTMNPDGSGRRMLLDGGEYVADDGEKYSLGTIHRSADGSTLVFAGRRRDRYSGDASLFIADGATGAVRKRIPISSSAFAIHGDELIATAKPTVEPAAGAWPVRALLHINLKTGAERVIELPGVLVSCTRDLADALCLIIRDHAGIRHRSLVWMDLATSHTTPVADEDEIPTISLDENPPNEYSSAQSGHLVDDPGGGMSVGDLHALLDETGRRVAWFVRPDAQSNVPPTITVVDLNGGDRHRLTIQSTATSQPTSKPLRSGPQFAAHGFTRGGEELVYEWDGEVVAAASDGGGRRVMARQPGKDDYAGWRYSPSRLQLVSVVARYDADPAGRGSTRTTIQSWHDGEPVTLYEGDRNASVQWLDDEQLILEDGRTITLMDPRGGNRRKLFEIGSN